MSEQYSTFLRITFFIHVIIGAIFGIGLYIIPDLFLGLFGMTIMDPTTRLFGAMMLALTIGSVLALATKEWLRVRIIVEVDIFWCILGLIGAIVHIFLPPVFTTLAGLLIIAILAILLFLFLIGYFIEVRD
ncbi:MAG: hypothetical protein ACFFD8_07545 [Candidatus Thorarchaeota archaeon]